MKIALTAIVIGTVIFGSFYVAMSGLSDDVSTYIENN